MLSLFPTCLRSHKISSFLYPHAETGTARAWTSAEFAGDTKCVSEESDSSESPYSFSFLYSVVLLMPSNSAAIILSPSVFRIASRIACFSILDMGMMRCSTGTEVGFVVRTIFTSL
ncbi:MAG: hypothetical protein JWQ42_4742 [Edaphobacter sp.]|nr:hypothetical protein [Edaphobacter sp.]